MMSTTHKLLSMNMKRVNCFQAVRQKSYDGQNGDNNAKQIPSNDSKASVAKELDEEIPSPPTTSCCMSGCANCVWIQYAEKISKKLENGTDVARNIIMNEVQDTNMRTFLEMELRMLKLRNQKS